MAEGVSIVNRTNGSAWPAYTAGQGQPGLDGGGTLIQTNTWATRDDWENIFGPAGRDVKFDPQQFKRDNRLHLPSILEGVNMYLTDKIDGLITDATNSPFTTIILPYKYLSTPDARFTWNRYSFDEVCMHLGFIMRVESIKVVRLIHIILQLTGHQTPDEFHSVNHKVANTSHNHAGDRNELTVECRIHSPSLSLCTSCSM